MNPALEAIAFVMQELNAFIMKIKTKTGYIYLVVGRRDLNRREN